MYFNKCYHCLNFPIRVCVYRCHKDIPDHLQVVPLSHTTRQCDLKQEVALQDLTHTIEDHLQLPVAEQPGLDVGQGLLIMLTKQTVRRVTTTSARLI